MTGIYGVYVTAPSSEEAQRIGRAVVERRLAACANVVPSVWSCYWWQGELVQEEEALLVLKTSAEALDALIAAVRELHPYTVPAVNAFPVEKGNEAYFAWVREETLGATGEREG